MRGNNYDRVLLFIACTVTIIWGITIIVQTIFPKHPTPDSVNQVMVIVATGFFGGALVANIRRAGKDDNDAD